MAVPPFANNGVEVSTNNQEYIYLVKPLAAIPESISKGDILTHCFVEVNDENILNMDELIRISQQEGNLVIAENMYATGLAIHIDVGSKNADYIKERLSVALHGIFTHIQDVLVIYFHKAMCKYITLTDTLRNSSQRH